MGTPAGSDSSEEGSQPPKTLVTQKGSWVRAVQGDQKGLKKYEVNISMKDGVGSVNVPDEVITDASPLWEDFLMGKFLDKAPHIAKIHAIVNKIWSMGDKSQMIDVFVINSNTMKFRVTNMEARKRILRRGMWNLAGIPVVMSQWTPFIEDDQPEEKSIPLWVHLKNVPTSMVSWQGLSFITSPVGAPVRLHPETAQCINIKTPKVFVNADLTKELPKKMFFNLFGKETLVEYVYPWLPTRCTNCMKWGHQERACLAPKKDIEQSTLLSDDIEEGEIEGILSVEKQNGNAEEEIPETNKSESEKAEGQDMEETLLTSPAQPEKSMVLLETEQTLCSGKETENGKSDEEYEREWSDVTPGKASRSPNKKILEAENVSIVSNSRFSVLSPTGEDGEEVEESAETNEVGVGSSELIEKSSDLKNSRKEVKEKEVIIVRQSLPRGSKDKHKFLSDITAQKAKEAAPALSKKSTRKTY